MLRMDELEETVGMLPSTLLPGHVAELVRSTTLPALRRAAAETPNARWCTYKKQLCDCGATVAAPATEASAATLSEAPAPSLLAIDCEFKPPRCAVVDASGGVLLDVLVLPDVAPAGRSSAPLPSILRCDRPMLVKSTSGELRERLRAYLAAGATIVAHTPQSDLRLLGFDAVEWQETLPRGVVDVARIGLAEGAQVASLRRMAEEHLDLPLERFQSGGGKHCAVQDALVTLRVYEALQQSSSSSRAADEVDDGGSEQRV